MFNFDTKKKLSSSKAQANRARIEKEYETASHSQEGIYTKKTQTQYEYYIDVIIDKRILGMEITSQKANIPEYIVFLIILDIWYPEQPPKLLAKSEFCNPSLRDGRDLLHEVYPEWKKSTKLESLIKALPSFISRVINTSNYRFYGKFHTGAVYNLKNFENMLVNSFPCKVQTDSKSKILKPLASYYLILTGDALLLFEKIEPKATSTSTAASTDDEGGVLVFWSSLYSITDLQMKTKTNTVSINFYNDDTVDEFKLSLIIENIIFFRDTLVKKMRQLHIKSENNKVTRQNTIKRLSNKEVITMNIDDIENNIMNLKERIEAGEVNDYTVRTFSTLCGRAIEFFSIKGNGKDMEYLQLMKKILENEKVMKFNVDNEKEY